MKLQQSRSRDEPEINVISLVDVLLVLVLFFMVSTSFLRETEISLQLPEATVEGQAVSPSETLEIMITQSGSYLVNGRELVNNERRTLRAAIERLAGEKRDVPVFIRADAGATHQAVVTAMDVAGQLGFVKLNIATVTPPEAKTQ
jgi:biopolymer transport protein ExbD